MALSCFALSRRATWACTSAEKPAHNAGALRGGADGCDGVVVVDGVDGVGVDGVGVGVDGVGVDGVGVDGVDSPKVGIGKTMGRSLMLSSSSSSSPPSAAAASSTSAS